MTRKSQQADERRRKMLIHGLPLVVLAITAFVVGVVISSGSAEKDAVTRFADAWKEQDFKAMHAELTETAAAEYSPEELADAYSRAQETATIEGFGYEEPRGPLEQDGTTVVALPM